MTHSDNGSLAQAPLCVLVIDVLRGLVMIIMALDHTRDFFHITAMTADPLDPATTTPFLFFTRWITHFCAPIFVMLSGVSAYLSAQKKYIITAGNFYITRGFWLMLVEVTVVTFGLTFNPAFNFVVLQVIWAIGCSMVLLGLLMRFSYRVILVIGLLLFLGHNLTDYLPGEKNNAVWALLLTARGTVVSLGANHMLGIFYALLPWTGIMFLGFSMGHWFRSNYTPQQRKRNLLFTGSLLILLYVVLRLARTYGDPGIWNPVGNPLYSLLNTSKYPPSLQYSGMTLGPALLLLAFWNNIQTRWSKLASVFGRVPFFYYILHIYLLHLLLIPAFFIAGFSTNQILVSESIFAFRPAALGYPLGAVYLIWFAVVSLLYLPCKWFYNYKLTHTHWWLKYL